MKKKSRKIIIGSLLAACILIMLPTISAVQFNTVAESEKTQIIEKLQNIDIKELKENIKNQNNDPTDVPHHPLLMNLVWAMYWFRLFRATPWLILGLIGGSSFQWGPISIEHPLPYARGLIILKNAEFHLNVWLEIAENRGWHWNFFE